MNLNQYKFKATKKPTIAAMIDWIIKAVDPGSIYANALLLKKTKIESKIKKNLISMAFINKQIFFIGQWVS